MLICKPCGLGGAGGGCFPGPPRAGSRRRSHLGDRVRIVGRLDAVLDALATGREGRRCFSVALLQGGQIQVGDPHQFRSRRPLRRGNRLQKDGIGLAPLFQVRRGLHVPHHEILDLRYLAILDLQPDPDDHRIRHGSIHFPHGAQESDLPGFGVSHEQPVRALGERGSPESVARIQVHAIFSVLHARRHRQLLGIVRDQRVHILIDEVFQTCAIAGALSPSRGRNQQSERGKSVSHAISTP